MSPAHDPPDDSPFALAQRIRERARAPRRHRARPAARVAHRAGQAMEDRALAWLQARGLALLERNVRCRHGEIDLLMRDGPTVVVVEVRARSGPPGSAAASLDPVKLARLRRSAQYWLPRWRARHWPGQDPPVRVDAVLFDDSGIEWLRDLRLPDGRD